MLSRSLALVLVMASCKSTDQDARDREEKTARDRKWADDVAADKARVAQLVGAGTAPRHTIAPPLATGETLVADIVSVATTKVWGEAPGDPPAMTRTSTLRATISIRAHAVTKPDDPPIDVVLTDVAGDLKNLAVEPRFGTVEPGAFGEPWVWVMSYREGEPQDTDNMQRAIWEHEVGAWVRRILLPLPPTRPSGSARNGRACTPTTSRRSRWSSNRRTRSSGSTTTSCTSTPPPTGNRAAQAATARAR